jgi:release factor glutamine methyltransferase
VLDLCAGSGCIGLAVASRAPRTRVTLGEISDEALKICRQNIRRCALSGRAVPMELNALEKPPRNVGEFGCIVSNPPYIPTGEIPGLDASVRDYEPHLALDGGEDGLRFYRAISELWKEALAPGGRLFFEVGIGQADSVLRIMRAQGFGDIQVVKDLHDIPRVVFGTLCTEV